MKSSASGKPEEDAVILLAGGRSSRMESTTADKILHPVHGIPLFGYSLEGFAACEPIRHFVIVYRDDRQRAELKKLIAARPAVPDDRIRWASGGARRQDSVGNALRQVPEEARLVLIHDCARPLVRPEIVAELARLAVEDGAACLAHRVTDTVKRIEGAERRIRRARLTEVDRERLWATETPQAFRRELITDAYRAAAEQGLVLTDDAAAVSALGQEVTLLENPRPNPKLTTTSDLEYLTFLLGAR